MAIMKKDPGQLQRSQGELGSWNPLQMMRDLMRFDPFQITPFRGFEGDRMFVPNFEVRETENEFLFKADLPGVKADDVDVELIGNRLEISGKRDQEQSSDEGTVHTYERVFGSFSRSFVLPDVADVDKIRSEMKDGVLSIVVPKQPGTGPQAKKIEIKTKA